MVKHYASISGQPIVEKTSAEKLLLLLGVDATGIGDCNVMRNGEGVLLMLGHRVDQLDFRKPVRFVSGVSVNDEDSPVEHAVNVVVCDLVKVSEAEQGDCGQDLYKVFVMEV